MESLRSERMDGTSDRSTFHTDDVIPCCLEAEEPRFNRFPKAELCVAGSAFCGFLVATGVTMVVLHYTYESREGFHSLMEHMQVATHLLGLAFVALAGILIVGTFFAYAVWKVLRVVEMAHRYQEHREFCAYEDLRQSFRSQQSGRSVHVVDLGRYSTADSKDTPRK